MPYDPPPFDTIPSPYNFVPLPPSVFFPDWASQVSMDVPFSDGISGILEVEVTAQTPIYIRNGGKHPETPEAKRNDKDYKDFFQVTPDGPYAIPGTSLKGMLRSVIEIASFGKLNRVDDYRHSVRDLQNSDYTNRFTGGVDQWSNKVKTGWLTQHQGEWNLQPCGHLTVRHQDIITFLLGGNLDKPGTEAAAKYDKYRKFWQSANQPYIEVDYEVEETGEDKLQRMDAVDLKKGNRGIIVFTGQPNPKKKREFVFEHYNSSARAIRVTNLRRSFIQSHTIAGEPTGSWAFWRGFLNEGQRVPVFYLLDANENPSSLGLAMLYRLPGQMSVHDLFGAQRSQHFSSKLDLAESMFGALQQKKSVGTPPGVNTTETDLKGRVSVGTFILSRMPQTKREVVQWIPGNPRPTFYPNYLVQPIESQNGKIKVQSVSNSRHPKPAYETMLKTSARLRGWKRYAQRKSSVTTSTSTSGGLVVKSREVQSFFTPLPATTTFQGKIRLHNIRPLELGALLWAIEWGGNPELCHGLGMGKPYGFGSVKLRVVWSETRLTKISDRTPLDTASGRNLPALFTAQMMKHHPAWDKSPSMIELLALANPSLELDHERLRYPNLKEFVLARGADVGLALLPYSVLATGQKFQKAMLAPEPPPPSKPETPLSLLKQVAPCKAIEKNKKGNWTFRVAGRDERYDGVLTPFAAMKLGPRIKQGVEISLLVRGYSNGKFEFDLPPQT